MIKRVNWQLKKLKSRERLIYRSLSTGKKNYQDMLFSRDSKEFCKWTELHSCLPLWVNGVYQNCRIKQAQVLQRRLCKALAEPSPFSLHPWGYRKADWSQFPALTLCLGGGSNQALDKVRGRKGIREYSPTLH